MLEKEEDKFGKQEVKKGAVPRRGRRLFLLLGPVLVSSLVLSKYHWIGSAR
jgi:hypothetical protein